MVFSKRRSQARSATRFHRQKGAALTTIPTTAIAAARVAVHHFVRAFRVLTHRLAARVTRCVRDRGGKESTSLEEKTVAVVGVNLSELPSSQTLRVRFLRKFPFSRPLRRKRDFSTTSVSVAAYHMRYFFFYDIPYSPPVTQPNSTIIFYRLWPVCLLYGNSLSLVCRRRSDFVSFPSTSPHRSRYVSEYFSRPKLRLLRAWPLVRFPGLNIGSVRGSNRMKICNQYFFRIRDFVFLCIVDA